jgi:FNIP Repeat
LVVSTIIIFYVCYKYIFLLAGNFDQEIGLLPTSLQQLVLSPAFNKPVDHLPSSLTKLTSPGRKFVFIYIVTLAHKISVKNLPSNLKTLKFGNEFNHPANNLPLSLLSLTFGQKFTQKIDLPPNLTTYKTLCFILTLIISLVFSYDFNQPFAPIPSLIKLCFGKVLPPRVCKKERG